MTLFSESLLLFYGLGLVMQLDLLTHSSRHAKFPYKTLLSVLQINTAVTGWSTAG